jgi:hypothetical protein
MSYFLLKDSNIPQVSGKAAHQLRGGEEPQKGVLHVLAQSFGITQEKNPSS